MWRNGRWDEERGETRTGVEGRGEESGEGQRSGGEGWGVRREDIRAREEVMGERGEDKKGEDTRTGGQVRGEKRKEWKKTGGGRRGEGKERR